VFRYPNANVSRDIKTAYRLTNQRRRYKRRCASPTAFNNVLVQSNGPISVDVSVGHGFATSRFESIWEIEIR